MEIELETSRFVGKRARCLWLEIDNGQRSVIPFIIRAESQTDPSQRQPPY